MSNKPIRTNQRANKLKGELFSGRTQSGDKGGVYHCANRMLEKKIPMIDALIQFISIFRCKSYI